MIRVDWVIVNDRLECGGLEIRSSRDSKVDAYGKLSTETWPPELPLADENPEILTATILRKLPLGAILYDLREAGWERTREWAAGLEADGFKEMADAFRQKANRDRGARRRGVPPLPEVAAVYTAAVQRRDNPTEAVRAHWVVSHSAAAKWVMRARKEGHLPPAARRKR
jgi:hypothetical protein